MSGDRLLVDTARRVIGDHQSRADLDAADLAGWNEVAWRALVDLGFQWMAVPEACGGAGGSLADMVAMVGVSGTSAPSVPLADSGLLGGWLLAAAGWALPAGVVAVIPPHSSRGLSVSAAAGGLIVEGSATSVPWASISETLLLLTPAPGAESGRHVLVRVERGAVDIRPQRNLAGELRDTVVFRDLRVGGRDVAEVPAGVSVSALQRRGALARAAALAGAMARVREMTVSHARDRVQFGRPIASFQAVAHSLALLAEHAEKARVAVEAAAILYDDSSLDAAGIAKIVAGDAATLVAARAHQVHAGVGMTEEYQLHRHTRALHAWSAEYGSADQWSADLGRDLLGTAPEGLWARFTDRARTPIGAGTAGGARRG